MNKELLKKIRSNPVIYSYLREESHEYIKLLKDESYLKEIEKKAKEKYELTLPQKLDKITKRLELINEIINVLN